MTIASRFRQLLGSALVAAGPDAPTLCGDFTTAQLAAHLWIRENRPVAAGGILIPALSGRYEAEESRVLARDYDTVVREFMAGPPRFGLMSGWRDTYLSVAEFLIHHEDVARVERPDEPVDLLPDEQRELYQMMKFWSRIIFAPSTVPVVLAIEGFPRIQAKDTRGLSAAGDDVVTICGPVGEVALFTYQRPIALVDVRGDMSRLVRRSI